VSGGDGWTSWKRAVWVPQPGTATNDTNYFFAADQGRKGGLESSPEHDN